MADRTWRKPLDRRSALGLLAVAAAGVPVLGAVSAYRSQDPPRPHLQPGDPAIPSGPPSFSGAPPAAAPPWTEPVTTAKPMPSSTPSPTRTPPPSDRPSPSGEPHPSRPAAPRALAYDYRTGDTSQWRGGKQIWSAGSIDVVSDRTFRGPYSCRFRLPPGQQRVEVYDEPENVSGTSRYYGFAFLLAEDYYLTAGHNGVLAQWVCQDGSRFAPVFQVNIQGPYLRLWNASSYSGLIDPTGRMMWTLLWQTPVVTGRWQRMVLGVQWSERPTAGSAAFWYGGRQVLTTTQGRTLYRTATGGAAPMFIKQGCYTEYRAPAGSMRTVWHAGYQVGPGYPDVAV
ncbi:MAG TPA: heparin lyase I family protein [Mycobacteriales bacterium]|nr:heparin lyase I family protein [Mycobacteriales bacterium]